MYTAPHTYTSDGRPHDSTFATGFPLSIAARCWGVRPSWAKIAAGSCGVWASAADAAVNTTIAGAKHLEIMAAPLNRRARRRCVKVGDERPPRFSTDLRDRRHGL